MRHHRVKVIEDPEDPDRTIAECQDCCTAHSGPNPDKVNDWADDHERENIVE
jgi:hypothetical protein